MTAAPADATRWVRTGITSTGIYRIGYERLREMGFNNPERVTVFGRGGAMLPMEFTDDKGTPVINNDLPHCDVYHTGEAILFYAQGPDTHLWTSDSDIESGGAFRNAGKNIYTDYAWYFLTDTAEVSAMQQTPAPVDSRIVTDGMDFVWHEADLMNNLFNAGQLFWGESVTDTPDGRLAWIPSTPDVLPGRTGALECIVYSNKGEKGVLTYGVTDGSDVTIHTLSYASQFWTPQAPAVSAITMPSDSQRPEVFVHYISETGESPLWLDNWTLTYPCSIPTLVDIDGNNLPQKAITLTDVNAGENISFIVPDIHEIMAFDVSDPVRPRLLDVTSDGSGCHVAMTALCDDPRVLVMNPALTQPSPEGPIAEAADMSVRRIHELATEGADLLIITVPSLLSYAEILADTHRHLQGLKVAVATVGELYNEFSAGMPDPMAYRSAVRLFHDAPHSLKNVLLFGPMSSDVRGFRGEQDYLETIIALQDPRSSREHVSNNINSYLGLLADYCGDTPIEQMKVDVGVGILPCRFGAEAETIIHKITDFLTDDSWAYTLGEFLAVGGIGDHHTHDTQARDLSTHIEQASAGGLTASLLVIDAYGNDQARQRLEQYLEAGKSIGIYIGHGSPTMLGPDEHFFNTTHAARLNNTHLPFMIFAACTLTGFDTGQRGMADLLTYGSHNGAIGMLIASRSTWSGQNMEMMKMFFNHLYRSSGTLKGSLHQNPLSIGEVWAATLSNCKYNNELAYQLMCDPALVFPVGLLSARGETNGSVVTPGDVVEISGRIVTEEGNPCNDFEGELVARLMEPEEIQTSHDLVTGGDKIKLDVPYRDRLSTMASCAVKEGHFKLRLPVSRSLCQYAGKSCRVVLSAYNAANHKGATGSLTVTLGDTETNEVSADSKAPVIENLTYDNISKCLYVTVSDDTCLPVNTALDNDPFRLDLDGLYWTPGNTTEVRFDHDTQTQQRRVDVSHLSEGVHSARVTVRDDAGNTATAELTFKVGQATLPCVLTLEKGFAVGDEASFVIEDLSAAESELVIADSNGNTLVCLPINSNRTIWNICDSNGHRVKPGMYRAYVRSRAANGYHDFSTAIRVPVV
ncbi:MAG: hypothetical protein K2H47_08205 [Muribaculaceae bacterium]|nr:hypothetical protein [Muribaculaceae bacterium]